MDVTRELDHAVKAFMTYEDYLDSKLTKDDLMFLEDKEMCRELLVLGFHSNTRIISREAFESGKAAKEAENNDRKTKELRICGRDVEITDKLMEELSKREEDNLTGCLATIIFVRTENAKGEEVSAYADFTHRLKTENWKSYISGQEKFVPKKTDLSFYNWNRERSRHTPSPNFDVLADTDALKLRFICRSDGCEMDVALKAKSNESVFRLDLYDTGYSQAVIFDHVVDKPIP